MFAFLAVRLLYPIFLMPAAGLGDSEELIRGALAHDLVHGLKLPMLEYFADDYSGGSLVVGLLAAPAFLVLGSSLFALRLVAVVVSLAIALLWYLFVARNWGRRAAVFTSLFFVLPPAVYLEASSMTMGFHTESMLFSAVAFLCLFELLYRDALMLRGPVGLGLALGFGTWFCYTTLASVAIVLVWWLWNDRRLLTRRAFAIFLACFALGFSPWLLVNAQQGFSGLELLETGLRYDYIRDLPATGRRLVTTALWYLPTLLVVDPRSAAPSFVWPVVYSTLFGGALLVLVVRARGTMRERVRPPACLFFVTAAIVYVAAVAATRYPLTPYGSWYLLPMLPFLFGAIGLVTADLWTRGPWGRAGATGALAAGALAGAMGVVSLADVAWPGASFAMPGYSRPQLVAALYLRHRHDYARAGRLVQRLEGAMTPLERETSLRYPAFDELGALSRERLAAAARHFGTRTEPARSIASFRLGVALESRPIPATDVLAELAHALPPDQWSQVSGGARLAYLARQLGLGALQPNLHRLPLSAVPDVRLFFLDPHTYAASNEIGWVMGEVEAAFLLEADRSIGPFRVQLTNGDRPNVVELVSPGRARSIALGAGQRVVETIELGPGALLEGKRYWRLAVRSRGGHFPSLTRGEPDARYLGIHVRILPAP